MTRFIALTTILLLTGPAPSHAAEERKVSWSELGGVAQGRNVSLTLPVGPELGGRVEQVTPTTLVLEVKRSSDRRAYPKGRTEIPRASVRVLHLQRRGRTATIIGTAVGAAIGITLAALIGKYAYNEGADAAGWIAGAVAAPTAVGFAVGYGIDSSKKTTLTITD